MPRFALLLHDSPRGRHYDFFLESGDVLKTWALPELPLPGEEAVCEALADHRPLYLDYEGPISGNRGSVVRVDRGTCEIETSGPDEWGVRLSGETLSGQVTLRKLPEGGREVDLRPSMTSFYACPSREYARYPALFPLFSSADLHRGES